jgi:hypothetical protein
LKEDEPGSEYDGIFLFTPPLYEQVPRPELLEYEPLLQMEPALAEIGVINADTTAIVTTIESLFIAFPL